MISLVLSLYSQPFVENPREEDFVFESEIDFKVDNIMGNLGINPQTEQDRIGTLLTTAKSDRSRARIITLATEYQFTLAKLLLNETLQCYGAPAAEVAKQLAGIPEAIELMANAVRLLAEFDYTSGRYRHHVLISWA
jgi:hypothetical protein